MSFFRRISIALLLLLFFNTVRAQQEAANVDSMKRELAAAVTIDEKVKYLDYLSRTLMNVDLIEAEKYGKEMIRVAEESRNRKLMVKAYKSNAIRCTYFGGQKDYTTRAIDYFNTALEIAKKEKIVNEIGGIQLNLSAAYLIIPDKDKALSYANQAFSLISTLSNDSLEVEAHNMFGRVYLARNEKTLSLRNFLTALRIAEEMPAEKEDKKNGKPLLLRNCYLNLSNFYAKIDEFDKAIDYYTSAYKKLDEIKERNVPYQRVVDVNALGNLFSAKKSYDIAISYFERSVRMADSLKFSSLKIPGYISLLNQYLRLEQPAKAMTYMKSAQGQQLTEHLAKFGFTGSINQVYGVIYAQLQRPDSANYYFDKALPFFESGNETNKLLFYHQLANFYKDVQQNSKAVDYFIRVKEIGEKLGMMENVKDAAKQLDTLYTLNGNYKLANEYNGIYYMYKDSIEKLNKEKELTQLEAADELQRQERVVKEKEESKRRRNNIQYLAITIGIVVLFIALVVLGMFKVSATTIKMIGFFAFLMFFEFIFLIFKKNIYSVTKGEPWKDLLFMIALAALLLPLHHWMEHKVIKYLTSHNRLTSAGHHIKRRIFGRSKDLEQ